MNGFVLFMMFCVSPPAEKAHPVWTLHSTSRFEFASMDACKKYGSHLQELLDSTDTVTMRGWCVNQGTGGTTYDVPNPFEMNNGNPPARNDSKTQQTQSDEPFYEFPSTRGQPKRR